MKKYRGITLLLAISLFTASCGKREEAPFNQNLQSEVQAENQALDQDGSQQHEELQVQARKNSNLSNGGYLDEDEEFLCYAKPTTEDGTHGQLWLLNKKTSKQKKLSDDVAMYVNIQDQWVYYCNTKKMERHRAGTLYRINTDTCEKVKLTEQQVKEAYLYKDHLYVTMNQGGPEYYLYRMNLDGTGVKKLNSIPSSNINILHNEIYYVGTVKKNSYIYKMNLDGTGKSKVSEEIVLTTQMIVSKDKIYYAKETENEDKKNSCWDYYSANLDGTSKESVSSQEVAIAIDGKTIYTISPYGLNKGCNVLHNDTSYYFIDENIGQLAVMIHDWEEQSINLNCLPIWINVKSDHTWIQEQKIKEEQKAVDPMEKVSFHDPIMEQILRLAIKKPKGQVYRKDLDPITEIHLSDDFKVLHDSEVLAASQGKISFTYDFYKITDFRDILYCSNIAKLSLNYDATNATELRKLSSCDCDIDFEIVEYPYQLDQKDVVQGIYPGNLINGGTVTFDGKAVYYPFTFWGDLPHPDLVRFDIKTNQSHDVKFIMTEQMKKILGSKADGYDEETISSLNLYKDKFYFISKDVDFSILYFDEENYDPEKTLRVVTCMDKTGKNRKILSTTKYQTICVANDLIYGITKDNKLCTITLDGKTEKQLIKSKCSYVYADQDFIYYKPVDKTEKLMRMNLDGSNAKVLIAKDCYNPIVLKDRVYYQDKKKKIHAYDRESGKDKIKCSKTTVGYNVYEQWLYFATKSGVFKKNLKDGSVRLVHDLCFYSDYEACSIEVIGDYLFLDGCRMKNDGTEVVQHSSYY